MILLRCFVQPSHSLFVFISYSDSEIAFRYSACDHITLMKLLMKCLMYGYCSGDIGRVIYGHLQQKLHPFKPK